MPLFTAVGLPPDLECEIVATVDQGVSAIVGPREGIRPHNPVCRNAASHKPWIALVEALPAARPRQQQQPANDRTTPPHEDCHIKTSARSRFTRPDRNQSPERQQAVMIRSTRRRWHR